MICIGKIQKMFGVSSNIWTHFFVQLSVLSEPPSLVIEVDNLSVLSLIWQRAELFAKKLSPFFLLLPSFLPPRRARDINTAMSKACLLACCDIGRSLPLPLYRGRLLRCAQSFKFSAHFSLPLVTFFLLTKLANWRAVLVTHNFLLIICPSSPSC